MYANVKISGKTLDATYEVKAKKFLNDNIPAFVDYLNGALAESLSRLGLTVQIKSISTGNAPPRSGAEEALKEWDNKLIRFAEFILNGE